MPSSKPKTSLKPAKQAATGSYADSADAGNTIQKPNKKKRLPEVEDDTDNAQSNAPKKKKKKNNDKNSNSIPPSDDAHESEHESDDEEIADNEEEADSEHAGRESSSVSDKDSDKVEVEFSMVNLKESARHISRFIILFADFKHIISNGVTRYKAERKGVVSTNKLQKTM